MQLTCTGLRELDVKKYTNFKVERYRRLAVKFWSRFFSFFLFRAVFQIPVESNYGLVIGFSTNENQNPSHLARLCFSRALSKLQAIATNSDWSIALFARVAIGRSKFFMGLLQSFENRVVNKVQNCM